LIINVLFVPSVRLPPVMILPATPIPPETTTAPVVLDDDCVVESTSRVLPEVAVNVSVPPTFIAFVITAFVPTVSPADVPMLVALMVANVDVPVTPRVPVIA
jgi:hypothetical protein